MHQRLNHGQKWCFIIHVDRTISDGGAWFDTAVYRTVLLYRIRTFYLQVLFSVELPFLFSLLPSFFFAPLDSSLCAYTQQQQQQQQHQQSTLIDLLQVAVPAAAFLINRKDDREREREKKKEAKLIISLPLLLISSCHLGNMPTRPLRILWIGSNTREKEREEYKDVLPLIFQQPHSALILSSLPPFPRGTNFLYSTRSTLRRAYATQRHAMQCNPYTIRSTVVYCTYSNLHT